MSILIVIGIIIAIGVLLFILAILFTNLIADRKKDGKEHNSRQVMIMKLDDVRRRNNDDRQ